jgi:hypothetical protein
VRYFHCLNFFNKIFIKYFSRICASIIETMRWDRKYNEWTIAEMKFFDMSEKKVTNKNILALPYFNKVF